MLQIGSMYQAGVMQCRASLLDWVFAKFGTDVLLAATASLIVSWPLIQYQLGPAPLSQVQIAPPGPASATMMQLVRDEHGLVMGYITAQTAAESNRDTAADEEDARALAAVQAVALAKVPAAAPTLSSAATFSAVAVPKPVKPRDKAHAPVAFAAAPQPATPQRPKSDSPAPVAAAASGSNTLLAKTLHATLHAVSAIGGIPNWIASMGDRLGGTASPAETRQDSRAS